MRGDQNLNVHLAGTRSLIEQLQERYPIASHPSQTGRLPTGARRSKSTRTWNAKGKEMNCNLLAIAALLENDVLL